MNKKMIFLISGILIVGLIFILSITTTKPMKMCDVDKDDNLVCITLSKISKATQGFGIILDPALPQPGEKFKTLMELEVPYYSGGVDTAKLYLQTESGNTIDVYDFIIFLKAYCGDYGGCSTLISTDFTAPSTPGDYSIHFYISGIGNPAYIEQKTFTVGATECPDNYCNNWQLSYSIDNGKIEKRTCYIYLENVDATGCFEDREVEYRTICDDNYVCNGYTTKICDKQNYCVKECDANDASEWYCQGTKLYDGCKDLVIDCNINNEDCGLADDGNFACISNECSSDNECNDNNVCTEDKCEDSSCRYWGYPKDGESCGTNKVCKNSVCVSITDPCSTKNCDDNNDCTTDTCENNECKHSLIDNCGDKCSNDEDCVKPKCVGATVACESARCVIKGDCVICKAYEELSEGKCKFSFAKLFTKSGWEEFYNNYTTGVWVGILAIILIIAMIIYLSRPKSII